ncbi:MAG: flagellar basal body-associated FliL family protein [Firmicutes bacterium]|nr:flagellar basal body-associated FliL family protein [Dethiobacter sp.]MBS3888647.1 flagellar basal body-associated FliL family protein [Bacillota bacterium]
MVKKVIIGVVVVALLAVAVLFGQPLFSSVMNMVNPPPQLVVAPSQEFTVNLLDSGMRRFLRLRMSFEYYDNSKLVAELNSRDAQVRDTVFAVLRTRSVSDLVTNDHIATLRQDLITALNEILEHGDIVNVYFVEFAIQ